MAIASSANSKCIIRFLTRSVMCFCSIFSFSFCARRDIFGGAAKPVSNILTPTKASVTADSAAVGTINLQQQQLLAKKRCAHVLGSDTDSIINIKKRNINHRLHRLKQIKENHADHVAEIYFLQTGGNMMDYPTWRKKAQTTDFLNFMKQYRLEPNSTDAPCAGVTTTSLSTVTASPTIQTVGQQSHSQNTTQSQPPPLISTNSPHGKPSQCHSNGFSHMPFILCFHSHPFNSKRCHVSRSIQFQCAKSPISVHYPPRPPSLFDPSCELPLCVHISI